MEQALLQMLAEKYPVLLMVFAGLGGLVVVGQVVVAITPSKNDDAFMAKLEEVPVLGSFLKALKAFAPIQKKDK